MDDYESSFYRRSGVRSMSLMPESSRSFRTIHSSNPILERSLSMARDIVTENPMKRYLENYYLEMQRDFYPRQRIQIKVVDPYVQTYDPIYRAQIRRYTTDKMSDRLLPPSKLRPMIEGPVVSSSLPPYYSQGRRYWRLNDPRQLKCARSDPYTPNRGPYRPLTSHPWRMEYPFRPIGQNYRAAYIHSPVIRAKYMYPGYSGFF